MPQVNDGRRVNDDWAWDQFDLTSNQGELDISNDWFLQEAGLDRETRNRYETDFIDDLYGTQDAVWTDDSGSGGMPYNMNHGRGKLQSDGSYIDADVVTWGLDLRRVPNEDLEVGSNKHYEWLTRGQVDWASYASDAAFKTAHKKMDDSGTTWEGSDFHGLMNRNEQDDADKWSDAARIDFIRAAQEHIKSGGNEEGDSEAWWTEWDNKYEPPEPRDIESPTHLPVGDFTADIRRDVQTASPSSQRGSAGRAASAAGIKIKPVNPKRPTNIPSSWGPIK